MQQLYEDRMTRKRFEFEQMQAKEEIRASIRENNGYLSESSDAAGNSFIAEMGIDPYGNGQQTERQQFDH